MEVTPRPIPPPRDDDNEDVHWALSTANALWGRGERGEALKWLRRAAEQASDANADTRALELFKAAAEVATKLSVAPPPPAEQPGASAPPPALPAAQQGASAPSPPAYAGQGGSAPPPPAYAGQSASTPPAQDRSGSAAPPRLRSDRAPAPAPAQQTTTRRPPGQPGTQPPVYPPPRPQPVRHVNPQAAAAALAGVDPRGGPPRGGTERPPAPAAPAAQPAAPAQAPREPTPEAQRRVRQPRVTKQIGLAPPVPGQTTAVQGAMPAGYVPDAAAAAAMRARSDGAAHAGSAPAAGAPAGARAARERGAPGAQARSTSNRAEPTPRRSAWMPDDEVTAQRDLAALQREQEIVAAALAQRHPELANARLDDLDEDTRVFDGAKTDESPGEPPAEHGPAPNTTLNPDLAQSWAGAMQTESAVAGETMVEAGLLSQSAPPAGAAASSSAQGAGPEASSSWSTETTRWRAPQPPRIPAQPVEALPAVRVAVLATAMPGEVRLMLLDGRSEPPTGAAAAILVPLSAADGELMARLLGGG